MDNVPMKQQKQSRQLTEKNKSFLRHLAEGKPTLEAYRLAGYKGEAHASYQLRSDLKDHLAQLLEQGGFSRNQLALEINRLNELPLDPNVKNVNFKQKLDVLRLMEKALPKPMESKPVITPFRLNLKAGAEIESIEGEIVDPRAGSVETTGTVEPEGEAE